MNPSIKFTEQAAALGAIPPQSISAGATVSTAWIGSIGNFYALAFEIKTGVLGTGATVDAKVQQATDATGTGAKDVSGAAIVQIVKASGDNVIAVINMKPQDIDYNNGFAFVRLSVTVGTAGSLVDAVVLGVNPRQMPANNLNAVSVVQIVG